jgi:hypothetical protein
MARFQDPLRPTGVGDRDAVEADLDVPRGILEGGGTGIVPDRFLPRPGLDALRRHDTLPLACNRIPPIQPGEAERATLLNQPQEFHGFLKGSGNTEDARVSDDPQEGYFHRGWKCDLVSQGQRAKGPDEDVGVQEIHASARLAQVGSEIGRFDSFLKG